jgi:hypothetical protein
MMNIDGTNNFFEKPAKIISIIFHPLFVPVYGMAIIFSAPTVFGYLPFTVKKLLFFIVLINNVLLPLSLLPFFRYKNIISSWSVENRRERIIPLLISTILYATTSFIIFRFPLPVFLKSFIFGVFFVSLTVSVINFWWKISIHSVGAGALAALVIILSLKMYSPMVWYLIAVILSSGLVLSSRLKLNSHNPPQVWLGFLTGFLGLTLFMLFF